MSILCFKHGQVKMYNLTPQGYQSCPRKDFNPEQAKISILTPQGFKSWLRKDFNPDFFKGGQDYFVRIHIVNDYIKKT